LQPFELKSTIFKVNSN